MTEGAAVVSDLGHAAKDGFEDVMEVFADFIAPIIGIFAGWMFGGAIGGPATVGQLVYSALQPTGVANATQVADIVGGLVFGGIWAGLGGLLWSSSSKFSAKKKMGSMVARAALRFVSGLFFGLALNAVISGFTGNVKGGWIESLAEGIDGGKAPLNAPGA